MWREVRETSCSKPLEDVNRGACPWISINRAFSHQRPLGMEPELFILLSFSIRFTFPMLNPVNFTAQKPVFRIGLSALKTPFKKCQGAVNIK